MQDYGNSRISHPANANLLEGWLGAAPNSKILRLGAMALYKVYSQDYLRAMLALIHLTLGPPLQAPELLS
ncbi:hypothetical protein NW767_015651, partial [Fusarium falciforme]